LNKDLESILRMVNEWLRYAEAKNGAALAFNTAAISVVLSANGSTILPNWYYLSVLISCVISLGFGLISFLPSLSTTRNIKRQIAIKGGNEPNLIYFGEIAGLSLDSFRDRVCAKFKIASEDVFFAELTQQIYVNSVIAKRKFKLFSVAAFFAVFGLTLGISFVVWVILARNDDVG
jgi:Family of unknown function (DUF5706)